MGKVRKAPAKRGQSEPEATTPVTGRVPVKGKRATVAANANTSTSSSSSDTAAWTPTPPSPPKAKTPKGKGAATTKPKVVSPKKRTHDSDTNNNANANVPENGPSKRVRTQRKPFQADDPIPKKILHQLLVADEKSSKPKPATQSSSTSKPAAKGKGVAATSTASTSASTAPAKKVVASTSTTVATSKGPAKKTTKVSVPTKRLSTSASGETTAKAKARRKSPSLPKVQINVQAHAELNTTKTKKAGKPPRGKLAPTPSPLQSEPSPGDDRPPFTTSTKVSPVRKRKSLVKSGKERLNQVSASSKKISKKSAAESAGGKAGGKAKAKGKKLKAALDAELGLGVAPLPQSPQHHPLSPLPVNAVPTPSPKKRKKLPALNPRPHVTEYKVDPTFESQLPMPFISTLVQSKLLIRAVRTGNVAQLETLLKDPENICSLCVPQRLGTDDAAFHVAVKENNIKAMKLLVNITKLEEKLGPYPDLLLQSESTGKPSYHMFGHAVRNVSVARGGKEGNDALIKDSSLYSHARKNLATHETNHTLLHHGFDNNFSWDEIKKMMQIYDHDTQESCKQTAIYQIYHVLCKGQAKLTAELVEEAFTRGGYGFNQLHKEALSLSNGKAFTPFKAISVTKKASGCSRVTPVHFAAINPDASYIKTLLGIRPEYNVLDLMGKSPMHFAAANHKPDVLKFLIQQGLSVQVPDKEGKTPLWIAAELGRVQNVRVIVESQQLLELGDGTGAASDFNKDPFINRPNLKNGQSPIHIAVEKGHYDVVNLLLDLGASPDRALSAQFDKLTPAHIAAKCGHLGILKLLIEKGEVNIEEADKKGKTALTHAVIEGQGHIVSYLLRLGVNNNVKDSSGNTLAHYAAAYGWYFIWNLLMEAGCNPNDTNDWKMTPVGIAFLKGQMGLVEVILSQPGIDINSPIDDTTGQNLLLKTCYEISSSFTDKLKFLIEKQGADCNAVDLEKSNALFYLVGAEAKEVAKRMFCYEWVKQELSKSTKHKKFGIKENPASTALMMPQESYVTAYTYAELVKHRTAIHDAVLLLLKHGCNPNAVNLHKASSLTLAFMIGCVEIISLFQANGFVVQDIQVNKDGDTILHSLVQGLCQKSRPTAYRVQVKDFLCNSMARDPAVLKLLKEMSRMTNKAGYTPLHHLIRHFEDSFLLENATLKATNNYYEEVLTFLLNELDSDVNAAIGGKNTTKDTPLHLAIARGTLSVETIQLLLAKKPNLDALNIESKTPLVVAIEKRREAGAKCLIQAGANVDFVYSTKSQNKSILIMAAEQFSNDFNILPTLIEKKVQLNTFDTKNGNSVLHLLAMKPNVPNVAETFQKLIAAGCDVTKGNVRGQTPLHLVVNERGGETDVSYDLEERIIEANPKSLIKQDSVGRIPLHYIFVKQAKTSASGNPLSPAPDQPFKKIDPIELVALFTRSMKDLAASPESIFTKDAHGATPLHYAAECGSIICISLLISELKASMARASIDERDENGNTAFGLAVWKGNDGAALQFQQNGADFLCQLNTNKPQKKDEGPSSTSTQLCEWRHAVQVRAEVQRELQLSLKYPILQEVINQNLQGLLHLMLEKLNIMGNGHGIINAIEAALKTKRFKLALKLLHRAKSFSSSLQSKSSGTLFHVMGKTPPDANSAQQVDVVQSLLSKNVPLQPPDEFGANALIYAAMNWNTELCQEFTRVLGLEEVSRMRPDQFRRTPFSAIFWKLVKKAKQPFPEGIKTWASDLVKSGASPNVLTSYPIVLSTFPGVNCLLVDDNKNDNNTLTTPLIMAVISHNYDAVKWLLSMGSGKETIELDVQDELGRTALMHAVRLNDIKMVKLLLNHRDYDYTQDERPWYDNRLRKGKKGKGQAGTNNGTTTYKTINTPNLTITDAKGWTVLHHLICPLSNSTGPMCFTNSLRILQFLSTSIGLAAFTALDPRLATAVQGVLGLARTTTKYQPIIEYIEQILKVSSPQKSSAQPIYDVAKISRVDPFGPELAEGLDMDLGLSSQEILKKVQEKGSSANGNAAASTTPMDIDGNEATNIQFQLKPDTLAGLKKGHAVIMQDSTQDNLPFDVLLTQVDLQYGQYGLYNFYKMQLIKQVKGKELILLFTRWGRVGDTGQYQKTPFPDEESAIKEFKKIFRAKTGNSWETLAQFNPLPKKYRLVNIERRKARKDVLSKVDVDGTVIEKAEKKNPSKIRDSKVFNLVKNLSLAHIKWNFDTTAGSSQKPSPPAKSCHEQCSQASGNSEGDDEDNESVKVKSEPEEEDDEEKASESGESSKSGNSDEEEAPEEENDDDDADYVEGSGLPHGLLNSETLEKGSELLNQISKLVQQKTKLSKVQTTNIADHNDEYTQIYNSLIKLSEEYFTLIPVRGHSFERIEPIFDVNKLRETQLQIHHLVHLEFATKILLASQLRANAVNPFDYVYKSLKTKIEIMDPATDEGQLILQYIHNTGGRRAPKVEAVYRLERAGEMEALQETGIDNRWLLWHGTKTKNILNILHSGLQAVSLGVSLSGAAFGKGIYFADMFEKSNHFSVNDGYNKDSTKFMLLCEVALGQVQDVDINTDKEYEMVDAEFNSFKTINSRYEPDPGTTVFWNGRTIPLGKKTNYVLEPRETSDDPYLNYGLDFNEYVVFNPNQVCLRYLVQFHE